MDTNRKLFKRAFGELRANGRAGYSKLPPRMRFAAVDSLRARLERDETDAARQRIAYGWTPNESQSYALA